MLATDVFVGLHVKNMNNCKIMSYYVWSTTKNKIVHKQWFLRYGSYNIDTNLHFDAEIA